MVQVLDVVAVAAAELLVQPQLLVEPVVVEEAAAVDLDERDDAPHLGRVAGLLEGHHLWVEAAGDVVVVVGLELRGRAVRSRRRDYCCACALLTVAKQAPVHKSTTVQCIRPVCTAPSIVRFDTLLEPQNQ